MDATVAAFNRLPRRETLPSGLPNHWNVSIRHVPLSPPGDLVHIVNPQSRYTLSGGPAQILSLPNIKDQVDVIIPLLLGTFVKGLESDPHGNPIEGGLYLAPWTWATKDAELARVLNARMKELGVEKDLCFVKEATQEEQEIADEVWSQFVGTLMGLMGRDAKAKKAAAAESSADSKLACLQCGKTTELKRCAKCQGGWYCSRDCQKAHWQIHKKMCGKGVTDNKISALEHYNQVAHSNPEAKSLAESLDLNLASGTSEGLAKPIRRLVLTGKDTPPNFELLFGPNWKEDIEKFHRESRLEVLLNPPRGSPCYVMNASLDDGFTQHRSVRPASEDEKNMLCEVRRIQAMIATRHPPGSEITARDQQGLISALGPDWVEKLDMYQLALNATNQGVGM